MSRAPISLCMIVRNEEQTLRACLESVRPYVDEICILDTGSTDSTPSIAREFADVFVVDTSFNDSEGRLEHFGQARQRSFDIANHDWVLWLDADDVLTGGEHLEALTRDTRPCQYYFEYDYATDANGKVTFQLDRERLSYPRSEFRWEGAIHEVLVPRTHVSTIREPSVRVIHHRQKKTGPTDPGRNLRLLKNQFDRSAPRNLFYLAREEHTSGLLADALMHFEMYVTISTWDEEKYTALCDMADIHLSLRQFEKALTSADLAMHVREDWDRAYFQMAKTHYMMADAKIDTIRNWERCAYFAQRGLDCPRRKSGLFDYVELREHGIHVYLNFALSQLGRVEEALASARRGLQYRPDDDSLKLNIGIYERSLSLPSSLPVETPAISAPLTPTVLASSNELPSLVLYTGNSLEKWDPETVEKVGNGGSEIAVVNMARELRALGHDVSVYNDCPARATFDGVQYIPYNEFSGSTSDIFMSSRLTSVFDRPDIHSKLNLTWVHDIYVGDLNYDRSLKVDHFLCLSEWHAEFFKQHHSFLHPDQVLVTRNGIRADRFANLPAKHPKKVVWSSSPDRGLQNLLDIWPDVNYMHPDAELHIFYGFENWKKMSHLSADAWQLSQIDRMESQIAGLASKGVHYHGRVPPRELADHYLSASYWLYSTDFTETSCITAMEAQASGLQIFTTPTAALSETVGPHGILHPGPASGPDFKKAARNWLVSRMSGPPTPNLEARNFALSGMDWKIVAKDWQSMFQSRLDQKDKRIVPHLCPM